MTVGSERSSKLQKKARLLKVIGVVAFVIGAAMVWGVVSYNLHDFYAENYEAISPELLDEYGATFHQKTALTSAQALMGQEQYWDAATQLEAVKQDSTAALQLSDWNKILCMIALGEKEKAIGLLQYYIEQPSFTYKEAEAKELLELY